jgi:hypothetical protein
MKKMDYDFEGQWSDDLRTKVIDQALEENHRQDLTDFIQVEYVDGSLL